MRATLPTVTVACTILALVLTWPLLLSPGDIVLPQGYDAPPTYADTATHISYMENATARFQHGSDPLIVSHNYAIAQTYVFAGIAIHGLLRVPAVVFHNGYFVASMILSGVFMFLLARRILRDDLAAAVSGLLYLSSFYLMNEYLWGHTNIWQVQWIPAILLGIERLLDAPTPRNGAILGVVLALQVYSSTQYAVYLTVLIPIYLGIRQYTRPTGITRDLLGSSGIALGASLALASPLLLKRLTLLDRTPVRSLSTILDPAYTLTAVEGVFTAHGAPFQLILRGLLLAAGTVLLVQGQAGPRARRLAPFAGAGLAAVLLAIGPVHPLAPYTLVYRYWPFIDVFRTPLRMLPVAMVGTALVSAVPVTWLGDRSWRRAVILAASIAAVQVAVYAGSHGLHTVPLHNIISTLGR